MIVKSSQRQKLIEHGHVLAVRGEEEIGFTFIELCPSLTGGTVLIVLDGGRYTPR